MDAEIRGQKGRLSIRWPSQMEALMNDIPLLIFFAHFCTLIYDTEESDHIAQHIHSATPTGNEWKKATKMFCLQSHQHYLVHKQFWPHFICFIKIQLWDHFNSYPVYFPSTDTVTKYFLYKVMHLLSFSHRLHLYSWDGEVMTRKRRMGKYWLL